MERRKIGICLLASLLLIAWLSPVAIAKPEAVVGKRIVNINTAPVDELVQLPRVGVKVAERIVQYRKANGAFKKEEELKAVRGIGDKVFEQIRPLITVK